jgi:thioredoxin 1|tara:strand:- start:25 stop:345 length:321 start_codon:yes stop_codon:yes gene_type:complete
MHLIIDNDISILKDKECLILFYFTATWCGPCQKIKPMIEKLSEGLDNSKVEVYMVDIDENDELALELKVKSVPTFYLFHKKELIDQTSGNDIFKVHKLIKDNLDKV